MKKNIKLMGLATALTLSGIALTSCHDEYLLSNGEGKLQLKTSVSTDMKVVSRADENQLENSLTLWIANEKGVVRLYDIDNPVPEEAIGLVTGHYTALAWAGDSVSASWDSRWFRGYEEFDINRGQTTQVNLVCKIANVGVSVQYVEGIENILSDIKLTVGIDKVKDGTLEYIGLEDGGTIGTDNTSKIGYFMMPSFSPNLDYTLTGSQIDGSPLEYSGTIENAKSGYHYILKVTYVPDNTEVGGGHFSIVVDSTEIEENTDIELIGAPKIQGYGFDLDTPIGGEKGELGRKCVYISSGTAVSQVIMESEEFVNRIPIISGNRFDLIGMSEEAKKEAAAAGINYILHDFDAETEGTLIQINFEKEFTNSLEYGERSVKITAIDRNGKSTAATLAFIITDDDVQPGEFVAGNVWAKHATLVGTLLKDNIVKPGFKYRAVNSRSDEWIEVYDVKIEGSRYTAELTDLTPGTTYEYITVCNGFESDKVISFTTEEASQLPNAGFENWYTDGKILRIYEQGGQMFWDSGNTGSATMNKNVTQNSSEYTHSGQYSAKLESQFVGMGIIGAFAAGNMFVGEFLGTENTTKGILGWGRPFTSRPKALKGYVKYTPATVNSSDAVSPYTKAGDLDQGIIYIAILDNSTMSYKGYSGWPQIVATLDIANYGFKKTNKNVLGYGEIIFDKATDSDGMIEFEIPIDYFNTDIKAANIIITASASLYGDYYTGGRGSTMYIDDIELVY